MNKEIKDEFAMLFARNLRRIMNDRDVSQAKLSKDMNIPKTTISSWMNGVRTPKMSKIDALCEYLNCKRSDLMEPYGKAVENISVGVKIPVLGKVAAGIPIEMIEDILDFEEIPEIVGRTGDYFGLKIKGNSMSPRINEGDVVIVRKQSDADSGDVVIAQVNGNEATCKKLIKHKEGISLVSFNNEYEPMYFSNEDIESVPIKIIGRVVENRQKY